MSRLLTEELKQVLPKLRTQHRARDPTVHVAFFFAASGWIWFVTEGEEVEGDFLFFGYVIGFESEWGYFGLRELEEVDVNGLRIERDFSFEPMPFSKCRL
ncbi:MAG: DUF2958 domain-containing protein [Acidobacteriota bacterium]|nr:MAG: DUF2958 domain-containing protein [Acidobacteriota bacterium]